MVMNLGIRRKEKHMGKGRDKRKRKIKKAERREELKAVQGVVSDIFR